MKKNKINATPGNVHKKEYGQFYTQYNIFLLYPFLNWFNNIPLDKRNSILEPFAGSNGLLRMLEQSVVVNQYTSYDINPRSNDVKKRDTIKRFPERSSLIVTNPPFLAKNVAVRKGLDYQLSEMDNYNDLYLKCLDLCLKNSDYLAIIIPESFIVLPEFKERLHTVISLNIKCLFKETEQPVCLALFNPETQEDYNIYNNDIFIGRAKEIKIKTIQWLNLGVPSPNSFKKNIENIYRDERIRFHDKSGQIGLICIDATNQNKKIKFTPGDEIDEKDVGYHSRLRTRIKVEGIDNIEKFISRCNEVLNQYREETGDIFLTSFKGLRDDGKYRRRIDFITARMIVNKVYFEFIKI